MPGRTVSKWVALLDDFAGFEPEFFGINEQEAVEIDPQHRLLLETRPGKRSSMPASSPLHLTAPPRACSWGCAHHDYTLVGDQRRRRTGRPRLRLHRHAVQHGLRADCLRTGTAGPAITVDTSCSSGLVALHMACQSLDTARAISLWPEPPWRCWARVPPRVSPGHAVADRSLPHLRRRRRRVCAFGGLRRGSTQATA